MNTSHLNFSLLSRCRQLLIGAVLALGLYITLIAMPVPIDQPPTLLDAPSALASDHNSGSGGG